MALRTPETDTLDVGDARLSVGIYEPSGPTRGMVGLFSPGWSAAWQDYGPLLSPLADAGYRAIAVNPRGHGGSSGTLDAERCIADLCLAYEKYGGARNIFLGHSLSAFSIGTALLAQKRGLQAPGGIVLMEPFIGVRYLPAWMRFGIGASALLQHVCDPDLWKTEKRTALSRKLGLNMNRFFANTAGLRTLDATRYRTDISVLYFLADKDTTLGVQHKRRMRAYKRVLDGLGPSVEDASELVKGLNHCWNVPGRPQQYVPFLKEELIKGPQKAAILEKVVEFCEATGSSPAKEP